MIKKQLVRISMSKHLVSQIENIHAELEKKFSVTRSDLYNEVLAYGLEVYRIKKQVGDQKIDDVFKLMRKESGIENDKKI
jgi:hypothetical protein